MNNNNPQFLQVIVRVLPSLSLTDRLHLQETCRDLFTEIQHSPMSLMLKTNAAFSHSSSALSLCLRFSNLYSLNIHVSHLPQLSPVLKTNSLRKLRVKGGMLSLSEITDLSTHLRQLSITSPLSVLSIPLLMPLKNVLETLHLKQTLLGRRELEMLLTLTHLTDVAVSTCIPNFNFTEWKKMKTLWISGQMQQNEPFDFPLSDRIRTLTISSGSVSSTMLTTLHTLPNLTDLTLKHMNTDFAEPFALPHVRFLKLETFHVRLSQIRIHLPTITHLSLWGPLRSSQIACVFNLPTLISLSLSWVDVAVWNERAYVMKAPLQRIKIMHSPTIPLNLLEAILKKGSVQTLIFHGLCQCKHIGICLERVKWQKASDSMLTGGSFQLFKQTDGAWIWQRRQH